MTTIFNNKDFEPALKKRDAHKKKTKSKGFSFGLSFHQIKDGIKRFKGAVNGRR